MAPAHWKRSVSRGTIRSIQTGQIPRINCWRLSSLRLHPLNICSAIYLTATCLLWLKRMRTLLLNSSHHCFFNISTGHDKSYFHPSEPYGVPWTFLRCHELHAAATKGIWKARLSSMYLTSFSFFILHWLHHSPHVGGLFWVSSHIFCCPVNWCHHPMRFPYTLKLIIVFSIFYLHLHLRWYLTQSLLRRKMHAKPESSQRRPTPTESHTPARYIYYQTLLHPASCFSTFHPDSGLFTPTR